MKTLVAIILSLVLAEAAYWEQSHNHFGSSGGFPFQRHPGHGFGRPHNPFYNGNWNQFYPQRPQGYFESTYSNAEWVCRSPKTGDIMIINKEDDGNVGMNGQSWPQYPDAEHRPNYPDGDNSGNHGETPWQTTHKLPIYPTTESPEDLDTQKTQRPPNAPHGGEGQIDIRIADD